MEEGRGQEHPHLGEPLAAAAPHHGLVEVSAGARGRGPWAGAQPPSRASVCPPHAHPCPPDAPPVHRNVPVLPEVGNRLSVPGGQESGCQTAPRAPHSQPPFPQGHPPPVPIELAVSKLHELGHGVQAGVEEPVEEDEPGQGLGIPGCWEVREREQPKVTSGFLALVSPPRERRWKKE